MSKNLVIAVFEIVGSEFCVASEDGQKICKLLTMALKENKNVTLSFRNINILTSAFLNTAIGQLYGTFTEEQIRSLLKVEDIQSDDLMLLKQVVDTAKLYFKDSTRIDQIIKNMREEE